MPSNKRIAFTVSIIASAVVAAAPTYHRTRPGVRCDIPDREYQYKKYSQPLRSLSNIAVLIDPRVTTNSFRGESISPAILASSDQIKSFQFVKDPTLQIDHCSISQMSVLLHESGRWTISLQADQNPVNATRILDVTTIERKQLFTDHLQRNCFHVVARCYAQYGSVDGNGLLGKAFVIPLEVRPFWVQRQQPYPLFESEYHPDVKKYFDSIDRVEIEFAYQLD